MKTLLIPTNFTDVARHATDYALNLYGNEKLKVILLNAFEQPKTGRSIGLSLTDILKKNAEKGLHEDKLRIEETYAHLDLEVITRATQGDVCSSLRSVLKSEEIDIIIMGSSGHKELVEMFVESMTAQVIRNIEHPMLIVPPVAEFTGLKNMILTTDCKPFSNASVISELNDLCSKNNCKVHVLNISKNSSNVSREYEKQLSEMLHGLEHDFNYRKSPDIPAGIYKFIHESQADIVSIVRRKGGGRLVDRLFHQSVSRRIVRSVRQTLLLFSDRDF